MSESANQSGFSERAARLAGLALVAIAVLSLGPLVLEPRPVGFVPPFATPLMRWGFKFFVAAIAAWTVILCTRLEGRGAGWRNFTLLLLAGFLAMWHLYAVDTRRTEVNFSVYVEEWQRLMYLDILDGWDLQWINTDTGLHRRARESLNIPHVYRSLPYGFVRGLERLTGDWRFAGFAHRWFFTFWFLWASFHFVQYFHDAGRGWLGVLVMVVLYPLSVMYYWGQLTDPMSHALFVLALLWIVQDRWLLVLGAVALGVMAKETAVVLVPAYLACHWRRGTPALLRTAAIGLVCVAAYVAVRLPVGWSPGLSSPSGTSGLMLATNLGIGKPLYRPPAPLYQNYLQPLLFVGAFLPMIAIHWRQSDRRLKALFLTVVPLVLLSSACFSWLYESRNYMPLLPLLAALALTPRPVPETLGEPTP